MAAVASSSVVVASSVCSLEKAFTRNSLVASPQNGLRLVANRSRIVMSAQKKQNNIAVPTVAALLAAAIIPEIAEAAQPGISPSLKNLLLSVLAGGTVLAGIGIAIAGVSTFDPVNRK